MYYIYAEEEVRTFMNVFFGEIIRILSPIYKCMYSPLVGLGLCFLLILLSPKLRL